MILSFSIENWMSFRDRAEFSMVASLERQHGERLPSLMKYRTRLLPVAAVYGGNASGKTNLCKALNFVRSLVVHGTQPEGLIPVEPFRLDSNSAGRPSRFSLEILVEGSIYEFSLAVDEESVLEERLTKILASSERILYDRRGDNPNFHKSLNRDDRLKFAFQGTRSNQLFLTNSVSQNLDTFKTVYDWFRNSLKLIAPDSRFGPVKKLVDEKGDLSKTMNRLLPQFDTGISHFCGEAIPIENIPLFKNIKSEILEEIKEGSSISLAFSPTNERIIITRENGELKAEKIVTCHSARNGNEARFDFMEESDGTQRLIDLLPAFVDVSKAGSNRVFVIDEIDRSLHTVLTRRLIESYLTTCSPESRAQLIFTTHDVLLMDQELLRRDEMWVSERDSSGCTSLFSFSEFKEMRYDKDIRKSYLQGRLGGIPRILVGDALCLAGDGSSGHREAD